MNFGEYLSSYMQKHNLTISGVASKAKIDRTLLSKALSGSRSLNRVTFKRLISAIELNSYEKDILTELYATSFFGRSSYENIIQLKKYVLQNSLNSNNDFLNKTKYTENIELDYYNNLGYVLIKDQQKMKDIIRYIFLTESNKTEATVYTNYPFEMSHLNKEIFNWVKLKKSVDFKHLVCFSSSSQISSEFYSYINALAFSQFGYDTYYYISGDNEHNFDSFYPYYIICSEDIVCFNNDLTHGIYLKNKVIATEFKSEMLNKIELCDKLVYRISGMNEMRSHCLLYCTDAYDFLYFSKNMSLFINEKTVQYVEYDKSVKTTSQFINELVDTNVHITTDINHHTVILYKSYIDEFLKTGLFVGIDSKIKLYVSEKNRGLFLEEAIRFLEQKNVSFSMISDKSFDEPKNSTIAIFKSEIYKNDIMFINYTESNSKNNDFNYLMVKNDSIITDYRNFIEYILLFSYTGNEYSSLKYLKDQYAFLTKTNLENIL